MKLAPLTLLFVCAAPARADVAVPPPKTWRDGCAARIDEAAKKLGLRPGARTSVIPLLRENGAKNPVQYVEYGYAGLTVTAGDDAESRPDSDWKRTELHVDPLRGPSVDRAKVFRRLHSRFGKIEGEFSSNAEREFKRALDECLKMGEAK